RFAVRPGPASPDGNSPMKIPRGFTEELRNQADIIRVVGDYVLLKKKGANYWACCPFHQEKTPSFSVNAAKQFFKCFGCHKAGDLFTFVMEIEGCSFPEAVKNVAEKCGVSVPASADGEEAQEGEARDRLRSELIQLNQWAAEFFQQSLTGTAEGQRALNYLDSRGVNAETRATFRLGYAPNQWDAMSNFLRSRGATRQQIERSGLVTLKDTGTGFYDKFRGRLMFPICDAQGRIVAFGGRIIGEGEPKYLNSPETALYTKGQHLFGLSYAREAIRRQNFAILVEGYLDFLIPFQAGVKNLVASLGTALTESQVRLLGRQARRVVVNFDPDSAGVAATKRSLELLLAEGFKVNVLSLPENLDPDEFIRTYGADGYVKQLKGSQPFLDYIVEQAVGSHDQTRPEGKVETINAILPYLKLVKDRIERLEHFDKIADRLKIDSQLIREEFKKAADSRSTVISERAATASVTIKPAERKLLELILNHEAIRRRMTNEMTAEDYEGLRAAQLFRLIFELERQGKEATYPALSQHLDDTVLVHELLPTLIMGEPGAGLAPESAGQDRLQFAEREATESLYSLRCAKLAERQAALQVEINHAQRTQDFARANELTRQKMELALKELELMRR
ncbi:MAG TPA: DNA primase, partial [Blastocatellia bacterium]|nr:DNA primase [Blastocatellia bacterium]